MNLFVEGFKWGLGFFCAAGIFLVVAVIFMVGIVGIAQLRKSYSPFPRQEEEKK